MTGGALLVLLTGRISVPDAVHAINPDVMLFLLGMFIVGQALIQSGTSRLSRTGFLSMLPIPGLLFFLSGKAQDIVTLGKLRTSYPSICQFWLRTS
ncbi:MAG: hypothetical protein JXA44_04850 [Methanospirillaceae archaeon]|nr:hypothetical protein [Methanospirillaceae archaeon]